MSEILKVESLHKHYDSKKFFGPSFKIHALTDVSFHLDKNETLGIVGESGCGKSTLARTLMRLETISSGSIFLDQINYLDIRPKVFHQKIQMVFQDPYQSLNPRKKAKDIIADPLVINSHLKNEEIDERVMAMMKKVGLRSEFSLRYPHHFSGGQRQRLGIARALMLRPEVLILDEPVSALDVSIQAQVLNLLLELQMELKLSYLFISHDLSIIQHMSDRILVIYLGRIMEYGPRDVIFERPLHPYTQLLLESAPKLTGQKEKRPTIKEADQPSALEAPQGCAFFSRCPKANVSCRDEKPALEFKDGRYVSCLHT